MLNTKYQSDAGTIHRIKISQEKIQAIAANIPPSAQINSPASVLVNKNKRKAGLRARGIKLSRTILVVDEGESFTFNKYSFVPILVPATMNDPSISIGKTITIGIVEWTVCEKIREEGN